MSIDKKLILHLAAEVKNGPALLARRPNVLVLPQPRCRLAVEATEHQPRALRPARELHVHRHLARTSSRSGEASQC